MTCDNRQVPRPATGKTPVRNARIPDDVWLATVAKAEMEGRSASDAMTEALRKWAAEPGGGAYALTYENWPAAGEWASGGAVAAMYDELFAATAAPSLEYIAVAAWLASTHHPGDVAQQKRIITGHILRFVLAYPEGGWRDKYRDARHLSETVQAILGQHLPIAAG